MQFRLWRVAIFVSSPIDLLAQRRHQTASKRSNFWHSDLVDNCESVYDYVSHLTCVMPIPDKTFQTSYILAINKTVKQ